MSPANECECGAAITFVELICARCCVLDLAGAPPCAGRVLAALRVWQPCSNAELQDLTKMTHRSVLRGIAILRAFRRVDFVEVNDQEVGEPSLVWRNSGERSQTRIASRMSRTHTQKLWRLVEVRDA